MTSEKKAHVLSIQDFWQVVVVARTHEQASGNVALPYFSVALGLRAKERSQVKLLDVVSSNEAIKDEVVLIRSTTQGRKQRLIYITNYDVRKALAAYIKERAQSGNTLNPAVSLFKLRKGSGFSPSAMQMLFKRMYIWAGLDEASSHSRRRISATSLIESGADVKAVSTLMG